MNEAGRGEEPELARLIFVNWSNRNGHRASETRTRPARPRVHKSQIKADAAPRRAVPSPSRKKKPPRTEETASRDRDNRWHDYGGDPLLSNTLQPIMPAVETATIPASAGSSDGVGSLPPRAPPAHPAPASARPTTAPTAAHPEFRARLRRSDTRVPECRRLAGPRPSSTSRT